MKLRIIFLGILLIINSNLLLSQVFPLGVQIPSLLKQGFKPSFSLDFWNDKTQKVLGLLGPGLVGFAATQINLLITTILATSTVIGAVSWLNYSFRLFQLPVGILGVSIGNSNLVHYWTFDYEL